MDLHTNLPYPLLKHGLINSYPSLQKNQKTDVAIIGGGITGALIAWQLAKEGIPAVVVDKRHVGMGSTAASTSLIQYEIDVPLYKLSQQIGAAKAIKSYQLCLKAIAGLKAICTEVNDAIHFESKCSLQYASYKKDIAGLQQEYQARRYIGFQVDLLSEQDIKQKFGMQAPAALLSYDAAQIDAYMLTHHLLQKAVTTGCIVYNNTEVVAIQHHKNAVQLTTHNGFTLTAKKLIIACGYESQQYLGKKVEDLKCTYAVVSEPFAQTDFWYGNSLIWETANPYLYMRTTGDNRILIGGKDTAYVSHNQQQTLLQAKAKALQKSFQQRLPHIPLRIDFKWAGAFGNTKDGLPYIGGVPHQPNTYYALGYGGNGITFSVIAAQMICAHIAGQPHAGFDLFSFNR